METAETLSSALEQHLASEFSAKSADEALATMMAEPHVNGVPLMIGACGRRELHDFDANHFLNQIPADMEMVSVSRTIGQGRVVDELIMRFTHSIRMDWILPGIEPTGKRVELPLSSSVSSVSWMACCARSQPSSVSSVSWMAWRGRMARSFAAASPCCGAASALALFPIALIVPFRAVCNGHRLGFRRAGFEHAN